MKKLMAVAASLTLMLCLTACGSDASSKVSSQSSGSSSASAQGPVAHRSEIESLSDVTNALNEAFTQLSNCNLSVQEGARECVLYDGDKEIGFIDFYYDDDGFAVFFPDINTESYDDLKVATDVMTATIMACDASLDVDAAKEIVLEMVENDETRNNGVSFTVGTKYDYSVIIVEL